MNNKMFLDELSKRCDMTVEESQVLSQKLLDIMQKQWQEGDTISLSGFGVFEVRAGEFWRKRGNEKRKR